MQNGQRAMACLPKQGRWSPNLTTGRHVGKSLWFVSGRSKQCALFVDKEAVCWCAWWTDLSAVIPEHHLEFCPEAVGADEAGGGR